MSIFNLNSEGGKKKEMVRGRGRGGGPLFEGSDYLNIFVKGERLFEGGD